MIRSVLDQTKLGEPSDHLGHRRRLDLQPAREGLGAHLFAVAAEEEYLFEIVLLRLRKYGAGIGTPMCISDLWHIFRLT